jgi:putative membrane-bound dehydrogenase-like protein
LRDRTPNVLLTSPHSNMRTLILCLLGATVVFAAPPELKNSKPLFDGKTLAGWECNPNPSLARVENDCLTLGNEIDQIKRNDFLATTRDYTNFIIRFKIKLTGKEGFINSGFQIRSQRVPNSGEMKGYQCDFGEPNWYGAIYDEERRNKVMSPSDMTALRPVIRTNDWNDYVIHADGRRIRTWINGVQGTDFIEQDPAIPQFGKLGIQIHGGGKSKVQVKDILIEELPAQPNFEGAAEPRKSSKASPLTPEEERATFTLPPGFEIELVAAESPGIGKFVTVAFDQQGRMWSMTALEYPVDANENPEAAKALYASIAKDKVVVFDKPFGPGPHQPRVFAEGLAIPLGILPYKNGVYVQHSPNIEFLSDTDGDGKADKKEIILSGFGYQDSHLFPHQFTRAPGNWIWMAQGAFNYGKVKTTKGVEQQFDQTRMAKFRYDGSDFDITSQGPCNIWGLVLKSNGEAFIQEANDYGYPMMQFHEYANYPGCSDAQMKSYAPVYPGTAPDFQMGGTGLSGLAYSDRLHWPHPYDDTFYIANPITRKIQAIRLHEDGPRYRLEKQPDFVLSSDEFFRPVAITVGPDGCLYIVDWYNKIISHNEVPRNHPERDKTRGRIWRVKPKNLAPYNVPDFTKLPEPQLLSYFTARSAAEVHLAWQAVIDRQLTNLVPTLRQMAQAGVIPALWSLEGLHQVDTNTISKMIRHRDRNVRREAIRAAGEATSNGGNIPTAFLSQILRDNVNDRDPEVRSEIIRTAGLFDERSFVATVAHFGNPSLDGPTMRSTHNGKIIKTGEAYEREFERYLVRLMLERHRNATAELLASGYQMPPENTLLAALALEPKDSAPIVAKLLPKLNRPASEEELLRLAQFPNESGVADTLKNTLQNAAALEALIRVRSKFDSATLAPLLTDVARQLWSASDNSRQLAIQLVTAFRLAAFEKDLLGTLQNSESPAASQTSALRALREIGASQDELLATVAKSTKDRNVRQEAILTLASSKSDRAPALVIDLWPDMNALQRRLALDRVTSSKSGAAALLASIKSGTFPKSDLDSTTLDKLNSVLPNNSELKQLLAEFTDKFQPVLRLDGNNDAYLDTDLTLDGPFTVETWIKLAPGIDNNDSILGAPGVLDLNFYDAHFRIWAGPSADVLVAKKKSVPDVWTHIAVTRDASSKLCIFINGELDNSDTKTIAPKFAHLKLGWSGPPKGTDAWLSEYRIWNRVRSAEEIRADFDHSFEGQSADGLVSCFTGANWPNLHGSARIEKVEDAPALLKPAEARLQQTKFARFQMLVQKSGDTNHGRALFTQTCATCHTVAGQGGQIGPVLNGAAANGVDTLLRAILTPNAAMEAGYRTFRVELKDGDVLDGFLVSQDNDAIILRQPNSQDRRIPQDDVRRARFTRISMMPEGLLDSLPEQDATDLLAYLKTLK